MFSIGEYVICGNKGVCVVENITTLDINGVDKLRQYYILKPVYQSGSTVYVPVDASGDMRSMLTRYEAERLIDTYSEIPLLTISNEKLTEQFYKECMKTTDCREWIKVLKTIQDRKQKREEQGRRITSLDEKYLRMAEQSLYGELALALDISRDAVEGYIAGDRTAKAEKN